LAKSTFPTFLLIYLEKIIPALLPQKRLGAATLNYGVFLNQIINFLIVAFAIFLLIRQINRIYQPDPAPSPPATKDCRHCLSAIPLKATKCAHCTADLK